MTPYMTLKTEAQRIGWPEHFKDDLLKHDRKALSGKGAPSRFGWILRQCGTNLLFHGSEFSLLEVKYYKTQSSSRCLFYWFEDGHLSAISPEELERKLWEPTPEERAWVESEYKTRKELGRLAGFFSESSHKLALLKELRSQ